LFPEIGRVKLLCGQAGGGVKQAARVIVVLSVLLAGKTAAAQKPATVWEELQQAAFDPNKSAAVENLRLVRDRIQITFVDGTIQIARPTAGRYYAAAFEGHGWLELTPPNRIEAQQLKLLAGESPLRIAFTKAVLLFTDNTYAEVSQQVRWVRAANNRLESLYQGRQSEREKDAGNVLPRLFQALLSENAKRDDYFLAELKTRRGWVMARYDAARLEQDYVGRWYQGFYSPFDTYGDWRRETWTSFPSGGRNPLLADENPLAKRNYLIPSCSIDATVSTAAKLSADARLHLRLLQSGERALLFRLDANLRIVSVRDGAGNELAFFQAPRHTFFGKTHGDYAVVALARPTRAGRGLTLDFRYAGNHALDGPPAWTGVQVFVRGDYDWYPSAEYSPAMRTKFTFTFHTPKRFRLIVSGQREMLKTEGHDAVTRWKSPGPVGMVGFCFSTFNKHEVRVGSTELRVFVDPYDTEHPVYGGRREMEIEGGNMIRLYDRYFGQYPYRRLNMIGHSTTPADGWPMLDYEGVSEFSTNPFGLGISDNQKIIVDRSPGAAYQWWGQNVRAKTYHDQWLIDSLAYYSALLYLEFRESPKDYVKWLENGSRQAALVGKGNATGLPDITGSSDHPKKWVFGSDNHPRAGIRGSTMVENTAAAPSSPGDLPGLFRLPTYDIDTLGPIWLGVRLTSSRMPVDAEDLIVQKGARLLHMLRMMLWDPNSPDPDHRFEAMLKDFERKFAGRAASTLDLQEIVEKHMTKEMDLDGNRRMGWFFREYVFGTGSPRYFLAYRLKPAAGGKWVIEGTLMRTGVPAAWKDVLPVYGRFEKGDAELGLLRVRTPKVTFQITVPQKPTKVLLEDGSRILRALPTKELASAVP
jgi:hypothetical protein